jgi:drug/metabolite transporter (DMT)-like permease
LDNKIFRSNSLLLAAAIIWGFAFVAQREGMEHIGPFLFNAIRFALGSLVLVPLLFRPYQLEHTSPILFREKKFIFYGVVAGFLLYLGSATQQAGLVYTTAGKAGFITGLYMVFVPIFGLVIGQKTSSFAWIGVLVAAVGLYFLNDTTSFSIQFGDLLELASAIVWAVQVLFMGRLSPRINAIHLAAFQFFICAILNFISALLFEPIILENIYSAVPSIMYAGFISVGIGYTFQVVAQKDAHPSHAAILMSLESVFALIGGWLLLNEVMSLIELLGCGLMFTGMIISQLSNIKLLFSNKKIA